MYEYIYIESSKLRILKSFFPCKYEFENLKSSKYFVKAAGPAYYELHPQKRYYHLRIFN